MEERRRRGRSTAGEPALATSLPGMLYGDDAGVVLQSPEKPWKMTRVIMVGLCASFSLTVSEAMTEIMFSRARKVRETTSIISVEAASQV